MARGLALQPGVPAAIQVDESEGKVPAGVIQLVTEDPVTRQVEMKGVRDVAKS